MFRLLKFIFLSISISLSNGVFAENIDKGDHVIGDYISKSDNKVYVVYCKNGTTTCNYVWDELCDEGQAHNADPEGSEMESSAFMRNKNNEPLRIFICK